MNYIISFHIKNNSSSSFCLGCFDKKKKISVFDMSNKYQNFTDNYECQGHFNDQKIRHILPLENSTVLVWLECKEGTIVIYSPFLDLLLHFTITSLEMVSMTTSSTRPSIPCSWKGKWCRKGTATRTHKNNGTYKVLKKKSGRQNATFQALVNGNIIKFYENAR